MRNRTRHIIRAAGSVLVGAVLVASTLSAARAVAESPAPTSSDSRASVHVKPGVEYLYSATYVADVAYGIRQSYGAVDYETTNLRTTISGSLPNLRIPAKSKYVLNPLSSKASIRTSQSEAKNVTVTNSGHDIHNCDGATAAVAGQPVITGSTAPIHLFGSLEFVTTCTGGAVGKFYLRDLPVETLTEGGTGKVGDSSYTLKFFGDVTQPNGPGSSSDPTLCPDYVANTTTACSYTVQGTITLKLEKKLDAATEGTSVTPKKVKVDLRCPKSCKVNIRITPLKGGPTIAVDRVTLRPGAKNVTIPLPSAKQKLVQKSGGVTIKLDYTFAGGLKYSETRLARL